MGRSEDGIDVPARRVGSYQGATFSFVNSLPIIVPFDMEAQLTSPQTDPHPTPSIPLSFPVYAQDPVFNDHDKELLVTLGITVVPSPNAFNLITPNTLLFCPGAERKHLELVLPSNPFLVFGGPLEDTGSSVIQKYVGKVESRVLVPFEGCEHAFWRMSLYFRGEGVEEENGESVLRGGLG